MYSDTKKVSPKRYFLSYKSKKLLCVAETSIDLTCFITDITVLVIISKLVPNRDTVTFETLLTRVGSNVINIRNILPANTSLVIIVPK